MTRELPLASARKVTRAAFTLIELLVVVATIAILITILIPTLGAARDIAKRTACLTNQQQIGRAIYAYANDFEQRIPFGPKAPAVITAADLYPTTGTPTSLISLLDGQPVGIGLMMRDYMSKTPKIVFCPATDQTSDADVQLARFGVTQSQSSYYYRHGSIFEMGDTPSNLALWNQSNRLTDLGLNRNGTPIRALVIDTQFPSSAMAAFGIVARTHHQQKCINILFSDGHASSSPNTNGRYTLTFTDPFAMLQPFGTILTVFEKADLE